MRISCGPRAQPALAFIVETERAATKGRRKATGRTVPTTTRNEKSTETRREERRKERTKVYSVRDGDVPRVAATDFAGDNNAGKREEKRQGLISNTIT